MTDKDSAENDIMEKGTDLKINGTVSSPPYKGGEADDSLPEWLPASETIETHISRVYLTDKFAYKQKKPVNFGFVDYTALEKRIFFAKKELSLNRRSCSGIYIDIVELRQKKDRRFIGFKGGKLIDVLVRMKRVEPARFLSNILKSGKFAKINKHGKIDEPGNADINIEDILKKIAKKIYLFHKTARTSERISKFGSYDVYRANWEDNYETIKEIWTQKINKTGTFFDGKKTGTFFDGKKTPLLFKEGSQASPDGVVASYSSFLSSPLFSEFIRLRAEGGFVRDVHGDLRMEHIAVLDQRRVNGICLMDCVEFDERYRCQDIYLDVAFLLMDFEFNGYFYESAVFFGCYKNYFNYSKSIAPYAKYEPFVIPFFKAYRAIVRTKIALLSPGKYAPAKALKYFGLAGFYLALAQKRAVILNCGLSGSGKSSLSRLLSEWFYARVISTDEIRQNLFGSAVQSVKYSADANVKVYGTMLEEGLKEFESGAEYGTGGIGAAGGGNACSGGVIFDATFLKRAHREKIINAFNKKDCIFIFVYSKIYDDKEKEKIILKRLENRFAALNDYSEADAAVYLNQKKYFEEPSEKEIEPLTVRGSGGTGTDADAGKGIALFAQIDAALELKDRFNGLIKHLQTQNCR